jgi:hypothetical protein
MVAQVLVPGEAAQHWPVLWHTPSAARLARHFKGGTANSGISKPPPPVARLLFRQAPLPAWRQELTAFTQC